jgi:hypothetical protein
VLLLLACGLLLGAWVAHAENNASWHAGIPSVPSPPGFGEVNENSEISDSQHDYFGYIPTHAPGFSKSQKEGYQVIGPDGESFMVDDIEQPTCAVYATYVVKSDDYVEVNPLDNEVVSNVYIEEVNFENCQ